MTEAMRVRFAPSPTGALHIGGVRTALYNYLLAKKNAGTFILRIEDTDQTRYVEGAEAYIIEALEWLGLQFDESPALGGPYGPYRQSERKAMYGDFAEQLVSNGFAYYAFDSAEELTAKREAFIAEGKVFKYDASTRMEMRNSLSLSAEETAQLKAEGNCVVRLKVPSDEEIVFEDMVRGLVRFNSNELDDKVMLKADGMPTYHLANIVDDYHMKITHVIRGEEWLPSTPTHVLLYRALGWEAQMPTFAHLPLILKPEPTAYINKRSVANFTDKFSTEFIQKSEEYSEEDLAKVSKAVQGILQDFKSISARLKINENKDSKLLKAVKAFLKKAMFGKLSKRDGDRLGMPVFPMDWQGVDAADFFRGFREWGFMPEAVLNILALLGWNAGTDQEIFSKEELISQFDMQRVASSGARFNFEKAKWLNQQYIIKADTADLAQRIRPLVAKAEYTVSDAKLMSIVKLLKERVVFLPDFIEQGTYFFEDFSAQSILEQQEKNLRKKVLNKWTEERTKQLQGLAQLLETISSFDAKTLETAIETFLEQQEIGKGEILPIFRLALSARMGGPDVYDMMECLGKEKVVERMQNFTTLCTGLL